MAKKSYSFYPGCSSQKAASASNYMTSVDSMCKTLDIELNEIPDWNCCSASIGYAGGGELPRLALSARNMAISEQTNPGQDIVATCAACWLATKETQERLHDDDSLMAETNEALATAGLKVEGNQKIRHMVEVLIEDFGYEEMGKHVKKPLDGIKIAGYVGCQTNRPFGIDGESYENPKYLDKLVETMGAEPIACAVVEDSPAGVEAGVAAGMTVFGYAALIGADRLAAAGARVFTDMQELPALLEEGLPT